MSKLLEYVNELLNQNQGDSGRLQHIKKTLEENKTLYVSDINYVTKMIKKTAEENTLKSDSNEQTKHYKKLDETSRSKKKNVTVDKNGPIKVDDWSKASLSEKKKVKEMLQENKDGPIKVDDWSKASLSEKKKVKEMLQENKDGPIKVDDWSKASLCVKCGNKMKNEKFCPNCGTSADKNENDIPTFAIVFGVLLIIVASAMLFVPINDMGMSTLDVNNFCKGPLGMLGQAFGGEPVVSACVIANGKVSTGIIFFLIGLILTIYGFVKRK
jgi:rubrerythrin